MLTRGREPAGRALAWRHRTPRLRQAVAMPARRGARLPAAAPLIAWSLAAGAAAVAVLRVPAASADVHAALARTGPGRMPWLGAAVTAEIVSLAASAAGQRRLLAAGGVRLRWRAVFGLAVGYAGLTSLLPAGPVAAMAWVTSQYRRRGASTFLGLWAVLSGGFAAAVTLLGLLLAGAALAGLGSPVLLSAAAAALAVGSAGFIAAAHRAGGPGGWMV